MAAPQPATATTPRTDPPRASEEKVRGLVTDFLVEKRQEESAQAAPPNPQRTRTVLTIVLGLVCLASWIAPYPTSNPVEEGSPETRALHSRAALALAAGQIEEYATIHGRLPRRLTDAGVEDSMQFTPRPSLQFRLKSQAGGDTLTYDSSAPAAAFLHALDQVLGGTSK